MQKIYVIILLCFCMPAVAEIVVSDTNNMCSLLDVGGNKSFLLAQYEINSWTCDAGYFLPADALGCEPCTDYGVCDGGTFKYDPNITQGIDYDRTSLYNTTIQELCSYNFLRAGNVSGGIMVAEYEPNKYECDIGYFLGANEIECSLCPENHYCAGGIYTFNETINQGIMECPNNLVSPTGMYESGQCGRRLYIGDNVVYLRTSKKTIPSLNFDEDKDGVPDYFANMSVVPHTMSNGSGHYLKISDGVITYYVHDDSAVE